MPAIIAKEFGDADETKKPALIALAVLLFAITIVVNVIANMIVRRAARRSQGAR
jgi:phosphate transport system permease protein